ncbi:bifunctional hydroxymethylpyrimidine kinase/phosphomethylpyrimidine kinase [Brevibacillus ginsengisoli]|uniref:bifunctional hydroxymethylpyrimidine kinase/phosphomethylpyrimidine kinase n=1 Tax=Brevibacillus ginsengisoli TaxID=363854 RepID=UPI003CEB3D31
MKVVKALTIAGSDSGGGAGIQADLKTFQELGVFGMSAITAITAQNTIGVHAVYPMTVEAVEKQLVAIGDDLEPDAVKTGMLFSGEIIQAVAQRIADYKWRNLVVDPVMVAKGGSPLLQQEAVQSMQEFLLPLARVVTPNIPEAEILTGMTIRSLEDRKRAASKLLEYGVEHVVMKGGHAENEEMVTDLLYDGKEFVTFTSPRVITRHTHGTGCTFAAAITAQLAQGLSMADSVSVAKQFIAAAIEDHLGIGSGHGPTNHWAYNLRQRKPQQLGVE